MFMQEWEKELYDNKFEETYTALEKELEQGMVDLEQIRDTLDMMYSHEDELMHRAESAWINHNATVAAYEVIRVRLEKEAK